MTERPEAATSAGDGLSPEAIAELTGEDTHPTPQIVLRVGLLIAVVVLANVWLFLQFGIDLKAIYIVEVLTGVAATVIKRLPKGDASAIDRAMEKTFSALRTTPALIILWALLVVVTLTRSTIVFTEADAESVTLVPGDKKPLFSDNGKSTFAVWISPFGSTYHAKLDGSDDLPIRVLPWKGASKSTTAFQYAPAVLIRIPLPHTGLAGGRVEILDANDPRTLLATANTTVRSASILLGRDTTVPATMPEWDRELQGRDPEHMRKTEARWSAYIRPDRAIDFTKHPKLIARFLTRKQIETPDDDYTAATKPFTMAPVRALNDIPMEPKS